MAGAKARAEINYRPKVNTADDCAHFFNAPIWLMEGKSQARKEG